LDTGKSGRVHYILDVELSTAGCYARLCIETEVMPDKARPDNKYIETEARSDDKFGDIEKGLLNTNGNPVKLARGTVMRGIFINHDEPSTETKAAKNLEYMGSKLGT